MSTSLHRRTVLAGFATTLLPMQSLAANRISSDAMREATAKIVALEKENGGRLGVAVLDTAGGSSLRHRAAERFPMCSTFKLLTSAAILHRVDQGTEKLDRIIPYGQGDLIDNAPITKAHVAEGGMSVGDLCAAAIDWSDNTAANLLLPLIGGPAGFTRFARSLGDPITRLDRNEPTLNTSIPSDDRDTTTPQAMLRDMHAVLIGKKLSAGSRRHLEEWLIGNKVGDARIRAGLPKSWRVGDKTGTGDNGSTNDIAILWPPGRAPILATVYYTGSTASDDARNTVHRKIGEIIAATF